MDSQRLIGDATSCQCMDHGPKFFLVDKSLPRAEHWVTIATLRGQKPLRFSHHENEEIGSKYGPDYEHFIKVLSANRVIFFRP